MKLNAKKFNKRIEDRWENGEDHNPEAYKLVSLLNKLDTNCTDAFELGGDGDAGEELVSRLSELIDMGILTISVK